ncbi:cytidine deaminase [Candidatus Nitrosocosmicus arcticus]|uniref:cytidine deaminase n=1 Tax=Candidatus Nitrosocosmicus arcticus TaxID=2035267 RepID=A0A557SZE4_9ARCH|nr:cytidine deaminase [Candidatus Nitrosocosmicus arcticus]TVP41973.1 Cytidine deaminase [Candidatus Nitrosocosmicus arcticus]
MNFLIEAATKSLKKAYNPYSGLSVGCALKTSSGKIYDGVNIENSVFGLTMCAERVAVFKAVSEGNVDIEEIAVVASTGKPIYPCGACRQVLFEFNPKTKIHLSDEKILTLLEILPFAFSKDVFE